MLGELAARAVIIIGVLGVSRAAHSRQAIQEGVGVVSGIRHPAVPVQIPPNRVQTVERGYFNKPVGVPVAIAQIHAMIALRTREGVGSVIKKARGVPAWECVSAVAESASVATVTPFAS